MFKDVKFHDEDKWPPSYVDDEEYWVLVEESGAPKGIVYSDHMQFAARLCHRYYLLDGGRVTHWLEDWHLSRTSAQLAILEPLLEMEAEIEALILLTPDRYLDESLEKS